MPELLAAYWTLAGPLDPSADDSWSRWPFADRVAAAARAGYTGFGIRRTDLAVVRDQIGLEEMRRILDDHGMRHIELEVLIDWFTTGERRRVADERCAELFSAAEALGARHLKATGDRAADPWPLDTYVTEFAGLCAQADRAGALVCLEPVPMTGIPTIAAGLEIVEGADAANGTLVLDIWHTERAATPLEEIAALPAARVGHVELNDAPAIEGPPTWEDTYMHRTLCGDGDFDISGFLSAVDTIGYDGPIGVEIIGAEHRARDLETAARLSFDRTMEYVT